MRDKDGKLQVKECDVESLRCLTFEDAEVVRHYASLKLSSVSDKQLSDSQMTQLRNLARHMMTCAKAVGKDQIFGQFAVRLCTVVALCAEGVTMEEVNSFLATRTEKPIPSAEVGIAPISRSDSYASVVSTGSPPAVEPKGKTVRFEAQKTVEKPVLNTGEPAAKPASTKATAPQRSEGEVARKAILTKCLRSAKSKGWADLCCHLFGSQAKIDKHVGDTVAKLSDEAIIELRKESSNKPYLVRAGVVDEQELKGNWGFLLCYQPILDRASASMVGAFNPLTPVLTTNKGVPIVVQHKLVEDWSKLKRGVLRAVLYDFATSLVREKKIQSGCSKCKSYITISDQPTLSDALPIPKYTFNIDLRCGCGADPKCAPKKYRCYAILPAARTASMVLVDTKEEVEKLGKAFKGAKFNLFLDVPIGGKTEEKPKGSDLSSEATSAVSSPSKGAKGSLSDPILTSVLSWVGKFYAVPRFQGVPLDPVMLEASPLTEVVDSKVVTKDLPRWETLCCVQRESKT